MIIMVLSGILAVILIWKFDFRVYARDFIKRTRPCEYCLGHGRRPLAGSSWTAQARKEFHKKNK